MHATENACMEANAMNTKACVRLARMDTNTRCMTPCHRRASTRLGMLMGIYIFSMHKGCTGYETFLLTTTAPHQACGMSARSRRNDRARRKCDARAYCCFSGVGMGVVRDVCGPQPNPMALVGFAGARTNAAFQRCMHEPRHASALPVACVPECRKCMEVCMACAKSACIERARENSVHLCTRRVKGTTPRTKTAPLQANACARPRTE